MVFKDIEDTLTRINRIRGRVTTILGIILDLLDLVLLATEKLNGFLRTAETSLEGIIAFLRSTAGVMRNSPLARGWWRIVFVAGAAVLTGLAAVLELILKAVRALRKATQSSRLKHLAERVHQVEDLLIRLAGFAGRIEALLNILLALCRRLETQQKLIEEQFPDLRNDVRTNFLEPVNKLLDSIEQVLDQIEAYLDPLRALLAAVDQVAGFLNNLASLASGVTGAVGGFVAWVDELFQKVKDWILSIPFVGWVLDKLDTLIDTALDKLGIRALLHAAGEALADLPFIRSIRDFLQRVAAIVEDFIKNVDAINQLRQGLHDLVEKLFGDSNELLQMLYRIGVDKHLIEYLLPGWLNDALEKARRLKERLMEPETNPQRTSEGAKELKQSLGQVFRATLDGPNSMFGLPIYSEIAALQIKLKPAAIVISTLADAEQTFDRAAALDAVSSIATALEAQQRSVNEFLQKVPAEASGEYHLALAGELALAKEFWLAMPQMTEASTFDAEKTEPLN